MIAQIHLSWKWLIESSNWWHFLCSTKWSVLLTNATLWSTATSQFPAFILTSHSTSLSVTSSPFYKATFTIQPLFSEFDTDYKFDVTTVGICWYWRKSESDITSRMGSKRIQFNVHIEQRTKIKEKKSLSRSLSFSVNKP